MRFNTTIDMLGYLSEYRTHYYRWIALDAQLTSIRSPKLDDMPSSGFVEADAKMNQIIQDKADLEESMRNVREDIIKLKDVNYLSYTIMAEKFIYFKSLEEIALMLNYSFSHTRNVLYPIAKNDLFRLLNEHSAE